MERVDVAVIGGGQAGLAAGYHLRRAKADFLILDAEPEPGGAWRHYWDALTLFSPAEYSTLPGWWMPRQDGHPFPTRDHVVDYLAAYEKRYALPVRRPVTVTAVEPGDEHLKVVTDTRTIAAAAVISATGTWRSPHVPAIEGREVYTGRQLHTVGYRSPGEFAGKRVVVVGGGNSAAQILADVSTTATTTWVTRREPRLLPGDVDGRALFGISTRARTDPGATRVGDLGDIVVTPAVAEARERGVLTARPMFDRLTPTGIAWDGGESLDADAIIWATGFRPHLPHLAAFSGPDGRIRLDGNRAVTEPRLHLLGYGDWTGHASATIIGAARTAKDVVRTVLEQLT
ncbi:monooxygenase [Actinorhabdospora filicis]|uniref:Monooxygenase n=1 Tax=Actinorhabdospora filicis TaxID=1785913 RepID=A0A9W6SMB8_9ACTN|nr:ArsO family NAD(P)H-dependent flavin-containing monooxygenase [Actinorhabdospora filicis]GLZ78429.1 monooxygenase [Actinorhabdospora filicis]